MTTARAGDVDGPAHEWPIRVYYEDTDVGGVVYYANYLRFIERARTELLRARGVDQSALRRDRGLVFVVRRCEIDYRAPARFDEALSVRTRVTAIGRASLTLDQVVLRADGGAGDAQETILVAARVQIACIDLDGRPRRLPPEMGALLRIDDE